ncbi:MBOAT family O-acyltransferase [Pseudacidovorax intermedius]|uniref:Probable alginate O-acetylase AlgI n=1 Tax=Pseudacidovorax intermedius TaxID=433924 RepID=A0A147GMC3_9BURK|nr:MBOAT family O-acyltransferase [Pseudacidovorax intermedius]KTT14788.1 acyltransferase [Pseudacidovorax intermedius]
MLFNSYLFLFLFLPVALGGYYALAAAGRRWAALWLCLTSFVFYGWWNPRFVLLLAGSIAVNHVFSRLILAHAQDKRRQWWITAVGVACNLALLFYYKYFTTLLAALADLGLRHGPVQDILLPLGISFFTFTQIGYLLDCQAGAVKKASLLNHTLFVTFFPHLIAGPVLHHKEMMPQFDQAETYRFRAENLSVGGTLFIIGLAKKVLLADSIAPYADAGFAAPGDTQFWAAWGAALAYTLQLYFDFSGYSDMALGLAKMFGVRFPLNFNSPFKAASIIDYWARWHMTLTRYLTTYLYYPMAMKVSRWRSHRGLPVGGAGSRTPAGFALMIGWPTLYTMGLAGVWHGAGLQFFIYGLLHGSYLCVNHAWRIGLAPRLAPQGARGKRLWLVACVLLTFACVTVAHVFFRAEDVPDALALLHGMAGGRGIESLGGAQAAALLAQGWVGWQSLLGRHVQALLIVLLLAIAWGMPNAYQILGRFSPALGRVQEGRPAWLRWRPSLGWLLLTLLMLMMSLMNLHREARFLYFQF